jgi:hypothetical protein
MKTLEFSSGPGELHRAYVSKDRKTGAS